MASSFCLLREYQELISLQNFKNKKTLASWDPYCRIVCSKWKYSSLGSRRASFFVKFPSMNTVLPQGRCELQPVANCVLNDCFEKVPVMPRSLIHCTHCTICYGPVVFSSEPDRKNPAPRQHPLQEGWGKLNYLPQCVINLKGMVISGWLCGDREFSVTLEGMVKVIQREHAILCLVL